MLLPWQAQLELVRSLTQEPETCREMLGVLRAEHFENRSLGFLAETALNLFTTYKQCPTEGQFREIIKAQNPANHGPLSETLAEVLLSETPPISWAVKAGREGAAGMELLRLGQAMRPAVEAGRFDDIRSAVKEALSLVSPSGELTSGSGTYEEIMQRHMAGEARVATGIHRLDLHLQGGLEKGRLGFVLGKKGGGKSHTLISMAGAALMDGLRVFYASLEMPTGEVRARIDRRTLGIFGDEFIDTLPDNIERLGEIHDRLTVMDATRRRVSLPALVAAVERLEEPPDVVFVDYLALLRNARSGRSEDAARARMQDLGDMAQDLRIDIANRVGAKVPVWSALQLNRGGIKKTMAKNAEGGTTDADITDAALSLEPLWHADVAFSINQSVTEAESMTGRVFLAENRNGVSLRRIECKFDWRLSHIYDLFERAPDEETSEQGEEKQNARQADQA